MLRNWNNGKPRLDLYNRYVVAECQLELERRESRTSFRAFVKHTFPTYKWNWHHEIMVEKLDAFARGEIKRLMLCIPPRMGKSEAVSRRFPAFMLGRRPEMSIISCSYADSLASRMCRDVQRIIDSPRYIRVFPDSKLAESVHHKTKSDAVRKNNYFEVIKTGGSYRSAGRGSGITGTGAHLLILDDMLKDSMEASSKTIRDSLHEWYGSVAYSRLENNGQVLFCTTRWHEDDLAGRLLNEARLDPDADQWEVLSFPAILEDLITKHPEDPREIGDPIWPEKKSLDDLKKIRIALGSRNWNAIFQQRPSAMEGSIIKRSWLKFYDKAPEKFDQIIQSWDLTFDSKENSDFTVGAVYGKLGPDVYLLDRVRERMNVLDQMRAIENMRSKWPEALQILIEKKANGAAVITMMRQKIPGIIPIEPKGSKEARLGSCSALYEAGNVLYPSPNICPWITQHVEELMTFPNAAHDDCVDSESQYIQRVMNDQLSRPEPRIRIL